MVYTRQDFKARIGAVDKKLSRRGRRAVVAHVNSNGVIYAKAKKSGTRVPVKGLALMIIGFFCFKAFMLAVNGPAAYEERLATLKDGTVVEVMGARILAIDPVTQFIADQAGPMFR